MGDENPTGSARPLPEDHDDVESDVPVGVCDPFFGVCL
jgi:hypothetical protein